MSSDNNLLILRLMWVLNNAPYEMNAVVKFKNGTNHGTIRWDANGHHSNIIRWTEQSFQRVVSAFTSVVMAETYGYEYIQWDIDSEYRTEPFVVEYTWTDTHTTYFQGFPNRSMMHKWLDIHGSWMEWKQVR